MELQAAGSGSHLLFKGFGSAGIAFTEESSANFKSLVSSLMNDCSLEISLFFDLIINWHLLYDFSLLSGDSVLNGIVWWFKI